MRRNLYNFNNINEERERREREEIFGPPKQVVQPNIITEKERKDPLRVIKIDVHSLLVAEQNPINSTELCFRYMQHYNRELDPEHYGFSDVVDLLEAMSDKVDIIDYCGIPLYRARDDTRVADIQSLVRRQMTKEQYLTKKYNQRLANLPKTTRISKINFFDDPPERLSTFQASNESCNSGYKSNMQGVPLRNTIPHGDNIWYHPHPDDASSNMPKDGIFLENCLISGTKSSIVNTLVIPNELNCNKKDIASATFKSPTSVYSRHDMLSINNNELKKNYFGSHKDNKSVSKVSSTLAHLNIAHLTIKHNVVKEKRINEINFTSMLMDIAKNTFPLIKSDASKLAISYKLVELSYIVQSCFNMDEKQRQDLDNERNKILHFK